MPTFTSADINKALPAGQGEAVVYDGAITGTPATGDKLNWMKIPAGTRLCEVSIRVTTAFAATAPSTLQLAPLDGSAVEVLVNAGDTVLATVNKKAMSFAPMTVAKDSYLQLLLGTLVTPAAGALTATALGMANGAA
jgi:hypothetical protein